MYINTIHLTALRPGSSGWAGARKKHSLAHCLPLLVLYSVFNYFSPFTVVHGILFVQFSCWIWQSFSTTGL